MGSDDTIYDDELDYEAPENLFLEEIVVFSRDWTIETIFSQIEQGNIDLNPKFQRRNAWKDDRRSRLIESLIIGFPVPEIVLAEDPEHKKSFIVIDGKQRLLTIAGFIKPEKYPVWENPKLRYLKTKNELNAQTFDALKTGFPRDVSREFLNADIRCTIISNFKSYDVLYDIFYRLNTGSVPLSSQELRQVLHKGFFADYLMEITRDLLPIHKIMGLTEPDPRLKDAEVILRYISLSLYSKDYRGDLRKFLDQSMGKVTKNWSELENQVADLVFSFNNGVKNLITAFSESCAGRKYRDGSYEKRINRSLLEVEIFFFSQLTNSESEAFGNDFLPQFKDFVTGNESFNKSISISTNNTDSFVLRFRLFNEFMSNLFRKTFQIPEFTYKE